MGLRPSGALMAISDGAYEAGIARLERELSDAPAAQMRADHLCHPSRGEAVDEFFNGIFDF